MSCGKNVRMRNHFIPLPFINLSTARIDVSSTDRSDLPACESNWATDEYHLSTEARDVSTDVNDSSAAESISSVDASIQSTDERISSADTRNLSADSGSMSADGESKSIDEWVASTDPESLSANERAFVCAETWSSANNAVHPSYCRPTSVRRQSPSAEKPPVRARMVTNSF